MDYLLIFINTHYAFACEKGLKEKEIEYTVMPSPLKISNSCGITIAVKQSDIDEVKKIVKDNEIELKGIYDVKKGEMIK